MGANAFATSVAGVFVLSLFSVFIDLPGSAVAMLAVMLLSIGFPVIKVGVPAPAAD